VAAWCSQLASVGQNLGEILGGRRGGFRERQRGILYSERASGVE